MMVLLVTLADKHQACPYCGFTAPKIKEYVLDRFDSVMFIAPFVTMVVIAAFYN